MHLSCPVIMKWLFMALMVVGPAPAHAQDAPPIKALPAILPLIADGRVYIDEPSPDPRGGKAYRLVYRVAVPPEVLWRFKTDFDNDFLVTSPQIVYHRLAARTPEAVVTEDRYAQSPGDLYRWETRTDAARLTLSFRLLNPGDCGQRFHYGTIRLIADGEDTVVVQIAYFDFFGAGMWARYPWAGGMTHFLTATANWEQATAVRLKGRYTSREDADVKKNTGPADPD